MIPLHSLPHPAFSADYLYTCGTNHDDGEFTHWGTFQAVAAQYIRSTYPQPWNDTAQKLIAFIAGVVSHSIADGMGRSVGSSLLALTPIPVYLTPSSQ